MSAFVSQYPARLALITERLEAGVPVPAIVEEIGISRSSLLRYLRNHGAPVEVSEAFVGSVPTTRAGEFRCERCRRYFPGSATRRFCKRHFAESVPRVNAVEIVRYSKPAGKVGGHLSILTGPETARVVPLSVYDAQTTSNLWPRSSYSRVA